MQGIPTLPVVYPATDTIIGDPAQPRINSIRAGENVFDPKACRLVADHLRDSGYSVAAFDYEPQGHGDFAGYTPENRETAEWIVAAFKRRGVTLHLLYVPEWDWDAARWIAGVNGGRVYIALYPFTRNVDLWRQKSVEKIAAAHKMVRPTEMVGVICPHGINAKGDDTEVFAFGEPLPLPLWQTMIETVESPQGCDAGAVWSTGERHDGQPVRPFDDKAEWVKALEKAAKD